MGQRRVTVPAWRTEHMLPRTSVCAWHNSPQACAAVLRVPLLQRADYCSEEAYQAALLALKAHEYLPHAPEQAARRARQALQVGAVVLLVGPAGGCAVTASSARFACAHARHRALPRDVHRSSCCLPRLARM